MPLLSEVIRFLAYSCCVWCVLAAAAVRAQPLRALVRIADQADSALFERVRGQTSDLELELVAEQTSSLEATRSDQLAKARELGGAANTRLVVWFVRQPDRLDVLVADLAAERLLVRPIERAEGELAQSAQDEAAALVVRTAVKASLVGTALGAPEQQLAPVVAPAPAPVVEPELVAPPAPPAWEPRWRLGAAVVGALDGATAPGHLEFALRVGMALRAAEFGLRGAVGVPSTIETDVAELSVAQHRTGAFAAYTPLLTQRLQLVVEAAVELRVFSVKPSLARAGGGSEVSVEPARFELDAERALLAAGSLDVGLRVWLQRRVAVGLSAGLELLPRTLVLGYELGDDFVEAKRLWRVQPRVALDLVTRF